MRRHGGNGCSQKEMRIADAIVDNAEVDAAQEPIRSSVLNPLRNGPSGRSDALLATVLFCPESGS
jgi:hypothetical protein